MNFYNWQFLNQEKLRVRYADHVKKTNEDAMSFDSFCHVVWLFNGV